MASRYKIVPSVEMLRADESRFWEKVEKSASGCWEWRGHVMNTGYGQWTPHDWSRWLAHRYAWFVTSGFVTDRSLCVCHKCDNQLCVNPDHLFLGTRADNNRDRDTKGRAARGDRHGTKTCRWSVRCKISEDDVKDIRWLRAGGVSYVDIAKLYPISTIGARWAATGKKWKGVVPTDEEPLAVPVPRRR